MLKRPVRLVVTLQSELAQRCESLPPNTFGAAYYRFMAGRGFEADDRPPVRTFSWPYHFAQVLAYSSMNLHVPRQGIFKLSAML